MSLQEDQVPVMVHSYDTMTKEEPVTDGGASGWRLADSAVQEIAEKVRSDVEAKHKKGSEYVVEVFSARPNGTGYEMMVRLDPGRVVNIRVRVPSATDQNGKEPQLEKD